MSEAEAITRKWGNSLGITIPREIVDEEQLEENQEIIVDIRKRVDMRKIRGLGKFKKSAQQLKDEMREGWHD